MKHRALPILAAALIVGLLTGCGKDGPRLASPRAGKIVTVVNRVGLDYVQSLLIGPDGTIYAGGVGGALAYPPKGEERSVYRAARDGNGIDGIALGKGVVYLSEGSDRTVRAITASGGVLNVAGNGDSAIPADGTPAAHGPLACPTALWYDAEASELAIRDGMDIRRIDGQGLIHTGPGVLGKTAEEICKIKTYGLAKADGDYLVARPTFVVRWGGDVTFYPPDGPDARAFDGITAMAYDPRTKSIYVADKTRIKRIAADGAISVVAGTGAEKADATEHDPFSRDDGKAPLEVGLGEIRALAVDAKGDLYLATAHPPAILAIGAPIR